MGIDPGTLHTGFGIIEKKNNTLKALDYGAISPNNLLSLHKRYLIIFQEIEKIIKKYIPDAVAIETQFVKKNVEIAIKLGMARGISLIAALKNNIPVFEYAPKMAKLSVVGSGQASKEQVKKMVKILLSIEDDIKEDTADALSIAICHAHREKTCTNTFKVS